METTEQKSRTRGNYRKESESEVLRILRENKSRPMSADEITALLREGGTEIGLTTVYRRLCELLERGLLQKHFGDGKTALFATRATARETTTTSSAPSAAESPTLPATILPSFTATSVKATAFTLTEAAPSFTVSAPPATVLQSIFTTEKTAKNGNCTLHFGLNIARIPARR